MSKRWTRNDFPCIKTNHQNSLSRWKVFCAFLPRSPRWTNLWQRESNWWILYYEDDYICCINAVIFQLKLRRCTKICQNRTDTFQAGDTCDAKPFSVILCMMRVHLNVPSKRSYTSPPKQNGQVVYFKRQWLSEPTDCELGVLSRIQRTAAAAAILCAYRNLSVVCCWVFGSGKKQSELHGHWMFLFVFAVLF